MSLILKLKTREMHAFKPKQFDLVKIWLAYILYKVDKERYVQSLKRHLDILKSKHEQVTIQATKFFL